MFNSGVQVSLFKMGNYEFEPSDPSRLSSGVAVAGGEVLIDRSAELSSRRLLRGQILCHGFSFERVPGKLQLPGPYILSLSHAGTNLKFRLEVQAEVQALPEAVSYKFVNSRAESQNLFFTFIFIGCSWYLYQYIMKHRFNCRILYNVRGIFIKVSNYLSRPTEW